MCLSSHAANLIIQDIFTEEVILTEAQHAPLSIQDWCTLYTYAPLTGRAREEMCMGTKNQSEDKTCGSC